VIFYTHHLKGLFYKGENPGKEEKEGKRKAYGKEIRRKIPDPP